MQLSSSNSLYRAFHVHRKKDNAYQKSINGRFKFSCIYKYGTVCVYTFLLKHTFYNHNCYYSVDLYACYLKKKQVFYKVLITVADIYLQQRQRRLISFLNLMSKNAYRKGFVTLLMINILYTNNTAARLEPSSPSQKNGFMASTSRTFGMQQIKKIKVISINIIVNLCIIFLLIFCMITNFIARSQIISWSVINISIL